MAEFKILKTWELETSINQILHQQAANHYSRLNMFFMLPIIFMSSALGTLGFVTSGSGGMGGECEADQTINILMGCFGYVSAILTTTHNFLNIQKLQATHSLHAVEYSKISRDIKMHIYLSETDVKVYANIAEYIKQCRTKIDKLIESADDIPSFIEKRVSYQVEDIRKAESKELNELIQLSKQNDADINDNTLDINDMTDLSEILVVKERRKSRDGRHKPGDNREGAKTRKSDESAASSAESGKSGESGESAGSKSSSEESRGDSKNSSDNSDKIQERLSLDTFFRSVKDKSARTSWKQHLKLLDDV